MKMDSISTAKNIIRTILELDLSLVSAHHLEMISSAIDTLLAQTDSSSDSGSGSKLKDDLQNLKGRVNCCYNSYSEIGPQIITLSEKFQDYVADNSLYQEMHQISCKRRQDIISMNKSVVRYQETVDYYKRSIEKTEAEIVSLITRLDEEEEKMKLLETSLKDRRQKAMTWIAESRALDEQRQSYCAAWRDFNNFDVHHI